MTRVRARSPASHDAPLQIVIRGDGRVAFGTFTGDMLDIALALAPQDERLKERARRRPTSARRSRRDP